ncbi:hypothetical protein [Sulfurirhabdus autotrophica]|uniref:Uncharacterized protein n=1 Tax=Sulfurirhabdus autotrophica TaxID=1706046 RepID=A0A4R3YEC5_9PROT|nr:hypothetical protein [Sulfurirhabdus autotrophica]TCV90507.1 hypothetical protein EDC63_101480 [Sulfurirhabdus autotrophica]
MNKIFSKLGRMFTAMSYAEAGNFDAVRQILNENHASKEKVDEIKVNVPVSGMPSNGMADTH